MVQPVTLTGASLFTQGASRVGIHLGCDLRTRGMVSITIAFFSPSPTDLTSAMCQSTWALLVQWQFVDSPLPLVWGLIATRYPTTRTATPSYSRITLSCSSVQSLRCL